MQPLLTIKVGEYSIRRLDDTQFSYVTSDYSKNKRVSGITYVPSLCGASVCVCVYPQKY